MTTYFLLLLSAALSSCLILIWAHSHRAQTLLLERICGNARDTVALYQKQMDQELDTIETWMYTLSIDNADYAALNSRISQDIVWYAALVHMRQDFTAALSVYTADGFLLWLPESETFLQQTGAALSTLGAQRALREKISGEGPFRDWEALEVEGRCYLLRILPIGRIRVGALVGVDTMLSAVSDETVKASLCLTFGDGRMSDGSGLTEPESGLPQEGYEVIQAKGKKMLVVQQPMRNGGIRLTRMVPYAEIQAFGASLRRNTILMIALFAALGLCQVYLAGRQIIQPVTTLTCALERLSAGELTHRIPITGKLKEYRQMSASFNEMASEIQNLKIDVYEEKLQYQELENQYLKQQITPHFMINCLNTVYQLAEPEHIDLARVMLMDLSRHLRYTLSSGQTVSLGEELQMVRNYVEMCSIRYPDCLSLEIHCPEAFLQAVVAPLLALNFVENAIKYEVMVGRVLEMHVEVEACETDSGIHLRICVWDNGKGFSDAFLQEVSEAERSGKWDSAHIGIGNVVLRLRHIYPEAAFGFSNREGAGAQIDIELPFRS